MWESSGKSDNEVAWFSFSQAVPLDDLASHTPHGLFDWHIEAPASPRNQKIGSP
jgi:hypothetical protein